jgi:hypothetical protein
MLILGIVGPFGSGRITSTGGSRMPYLMQSGADGCVGRGGICWAEDVKQGGCNEDASQIKRRR